MDLMSAYTLNKVQGVQGFSGLSGLQGLSETGKLTSLKTKENGQAEGTMFEAFLNSAIDNIKTTNAYLSDKENEEIRFAMGEVDNTHDLAIALQKASAALQYTVAVRDKLMESYKELMQMQI